MTLRHLRPFAMVADGRPFTSGERWQMVARGLWFMVALIILCWGAKQRFFLPLDPLVDDDCYGYLNPGFSKLTGGGFDHSIGREFLYPAFIFLDLCLFGDFRAITICQHLIGLAAAGMLLAAWQSLLALRPVARGAVNDARGFFVAAGWQVPGFLMASIYLGYRPMLLSEHTIRPESVFSFFAVLSIWMNLRFIRLRWLEASPAAAWNVGAKHLFLSCVMFFLRPSCAFAVVFINLPLAVALCTTRGEPLRAKWRPAALALAGAILLLYLPEAVLRRNDRLAVTLLPSMRFFVHADIVLRQLDDDLASGRPLRYDRAELQAIRDRLASNLEASRRPESSPWPRLGFNPDHLYLAKDVLDPFFPDSDEANDRPLANFCNYYCVRMALHHPLAMAAKVLTQLTFFYSFEPTTLFWKTHYRPFDRFQRRIPRLQLNDPNLYPLTDTATSSPSFRRRFEFSTMGKSYLKRCEHLSHSLKPVPQAAVLQWIDDLLLATYLPVLTLTVAACVPVLSLRRLRDTLGVNAWATLLLYSYNFGVSLTIATVFYLGQSRYVEMQKAFTLFSEFAGLVFLGQCARAAMLLRRPPPTVS